MNDVNYPVLKSKSQQKQQDQAIKYVYKPPDKEIDPSELPKDYVIFDKNNVASIPFPYVAVALIGEAKVGKTTMKRRFAERRFFDQRIETVNYDTLLWWVMTNPPAYDVPTRVIFYDTAGQEIYDVFKPTILRQTDAALLVFDATSRATFEKCKKWHKMLMEHKPTCLIMLLANKYDCYTKKDSDTGEYIYKQWMLTAQATPEQRALAEQNPADYVDIDAAWRDLGCVGFACTSAFNGTGIDEAFVELIDRTVKWQKADFTDCKQREEDQKKGKSSTGGIPNDTPRVRTIDNGGDIIDLAPRDRRTRRTQAPQKPPEKSCCST